MVARRSLLAALALALAGSAAAPGGAIADPPAPPAAPAGPASAPKIVLEKEEHDFGVVRQETEVKTEIAVRNEGTAVLHVKEVRSDCGCVQGRISSKEIAPGGKATLTVSFHTLSFSGPVSKRVHVRSDDPARPDATILARVDVSAGIVLDPPRFYFGNVLKGSSPTVTVGVKWKDGAGKPFRVTAVEAPGLESLKFDVTPFESPPWHGWNVVASFRTPPQIGTVQGTAIVRTDDADAPRIDVVVSAFVSGKVWLMMREVSFGFVRQGQSRSIPIECRGLTPDVDLGEVTVASRHGRAKAIATRIAGRPKEWTVFVTLPDDAPPGKMDDVIEVRTAVPEEPVTEIAVRGEVLPSSTATKPPVPATR